MMKSFCPAVLFVVTVLPTVMGQLPDVIDLTDVGTATAPGTKIDGRDYRDELGNWGSGVGDVNGDGFEDIIIGSYRADPLGRTFAGECYLLYGSEDGIAGGGHVSVDDIDGQNGVVIQGTEAPNGNDGINGGQQGFGTGIGDVNGDGYGDFVVAGNRVDTVNGINTGRAILIFGGPNLFGGVSQFDLNDFDASHGVVYDGLDPYDAVSSVRGIGDFNGDGVSDFFVGSLNADDEGIESVGECYLIFGVQNGWSADFPTDLASLDGENGVLIKGFADLGFGPWAGRASGVGDLNGDGFCEVAIGGSSRDHDNRPTAGGLHVIPGRAAAPSGVWDLDDYVDIGAIYIQGAEDGDRAGSYANNISGVGDFNGDGYDDMAFGAPETPRDGDVFVGGAWLMYGGSNFFERGNIIDLAEVSPEAAQYFRGFQEYGLAGASIAGAGDINGDGLGDLLIGSQPTHDDFGKSADYIDTNYLVYGTKNALGVDGVFDLQHVSGEVGVQILEEDPTDGLGRLTSSAGDVNGDGIMDLMVSSFVADTAGGMNTGRAYVIQGRETTYLATHQAWIRPGERFQRGVGMVGNGSHSIPFSRCSLGFLDEYTSGITPIPTSVEPPSGVNEEATWNAVIISRDGSQISGLDNQATVLWAVISERVKQIFMWATFNYLESEVVGLDPDKLAIHWALSETGPWYVVPMQSHNADNNQFRIALPRQRDTHVLFFAIAESTEEVQDLGDISGMLTSGNYAALTADFNLDGKVDVADQVTGILANPGL